MKFEQWWDKMIVSSPEVFKSTPKDIAHLAWIAAKEDTLKDRLEVNLA